MCLIYLANNKPHIIIFHGKKGEGVVGVRMGEGVVGVYLKSIPYCALM